MITPLRINRRSSLALRLLTAFACAASLLSLPISADDDTPTETPLMAVGMPNLGWTFDNGQEFKGATGSLAIDPDNKHGDNDALKLTGDFTGGGAYVQASCRVPGINIDKLTIWYRSPSSGTMTLRLIDETDQCHQIKIRIDAGSNWEKVVLPVAAYFAGREPNKRQDVDIVNDYQNWGGANDKKWHGACKGLSILTGPTAAEKTVSLWLADVTVTTKPPPPTDAP